MLAGHTDGSHRGLRVQGIGREGQGCLAKLLLRCFGIVRIPPHEHNSGAAGDESVRGGKAQTSCPSNHDKRFPAESQTIHV